jgi:hypothetical protein
MALEVYYPQDVRNALLAAEQSSGAALRALGHEKSAFAEGYQEGYRAALTTIALAFGLYHHGDAAPDFGEGDWQPTLLPQTRRRNGSGGHQR